MTTTFNQFPGRYGGRLVPVAIFLVALTGFGSGGASAQGWFDLSRRAPDPAPVAVPSAEIADLSLRIDRLEELVRRLNGEIEVLRHRLGEGGTSPELSAAPPPVSPQPLAPVASATPQAPYPSPQVAPVAASQAPQAMSYEEAVRAFNEQAVVEYGSQPAGQGAPQSGGPTSLLPPSNVSANPGQGAGQVVLGAPEQPLGTLPASALRGGQAEPVPPTPAGGSNQTVAALDSVVIEDAYSQAYSLMIAQDYPAAEAAFQTFIARYPGHELTGNAQYWLAETFYARGQYRRAAQEFLAGYQTYASSTKAPDSLLKLGMTLAALEQTDQACASFGEVSARFPNADPAIIERARSESARVGC